MKKIIGPFIAMVLYSVVGMAQDGVSISTVNETPDPSAILDVKSTNKGVLVPRMTTAERDAIVTPAPGLLIYNTTALAFEYYNGTTWSHIGSGATGNDGDWTVSGNDMYATPTGSVGIGLSQPNPNTKLHINGNNELLRLEGTSNSYISFYPEGSGSDFGYFGFNGPSHDMQWHNDFSDGEINISSRNNGQVLINPDNSNGNVGIGTDNPDNQLKLDVDGDVRFRQKVGIGTISPVALFDVNGYAHFGQDVSIGTLNQFGILTVGSNGGTGNDELLSLEDGYVSFYDNTTVIGRLGSTPAANSNEIRLESDNSTIMIEGDNNLPVLLNSTLSSGPIGMGMQTPDPTLKLDIEGNTRLMGNFGIGRLPGTGFSDLVTINAPSHDVGLLLVSSDGIGEYGLKVVASSGSHSAIAVRSDEGSSGVEAFEVRGNGNVYVNGTLVHGSDMTLKENIDTIHDALQLIKKIRGVKFNWIDPNQGTGTQMGFIAQEVETVFPELVTTTPSGLKAVNYSGMIAPLVEAVKKQQKMIKRLRRRVRDLEEIVNND